MYRLPIGSDRRGETGPRIREISLEKDVGENVEKRSSELRVGEEKQNRDGSKKGSRRQSEKRRRAKSSRYDKKGKEKRKRTGTAKRRKKKESNETYRVSINFSQIGRVPIPSKEIYKHPLYGRPVNLRLP